MEKVRLVPFLDCALGQAIELQVFVDRNRDRDLVLQFGMTGAIDRLELAPISDSPTRLDRLWETTCFEFFFGVPGQKTYWEVNLSPSGHWNVFRLDGYRGNLREEPAIAALPFCVQRESDRLTLDLTFDLQALALSQAAIELSVTSVMQEKTGEISYWALTHSGDEADFHRRDSFILSL